MANALNITDLGLFDLLKTKIGEKEAKVLVHFVKQEIEAGLERSKHTLATREDIKEVRIELVGLRTEIKEEFVRTENKTNKIVGFAVSLLLGLMYFLHTQTTEQIKILQEQTNEQIKQTNEQIKVLQEQMYRQSEKSDRQYEQMMLFLLNIQDKK